MTRWIALFGFAWLGACGGSPAKSPDDVESDAASSESEGASEPGAETAESAEAAPAAESKSEGASAPASKEDLQGVLQLVIDDEELTPYLKLERTDRFPIRIAGEIPADLVLTKATQPVQIVDAAEAQPKGKEKAKPVIVFTEISIQGDSASVRYRYDIEGVRGACTLEKRDGRWVLKRSRVTARSAE